MEWSNHALKEGVGLAQIVLLGVNHNDPFGSELLKNELKALMQRPFLPSCIAVEWKKEAAEAVIAQRPLFMRLAAERFPDASCADIKKLVSTLAYEADSFADIYPDLPIYWLDRDRRDTNRAVATYAQDRLNLYAGIVGFSVFDIEHISRECCLRGLECEFFPGPRDISFMRVLNQAVCDGHEGIVVILGYNHTRADISRSLADLLLQAGHKVEQIDVSGGRHCTESIGTRCE